MILVPGAYFFIRREEVAATLSESEQAALCELSLEALSPFPLEQLAWGWHRARNGEALLMFAACIPRLKGEGYDSWPEAEHVFPDFFPFILARPTEDPVVVYMHGSWLGGLLFDETAVSLPKKWAFIALPGKTAEEWKTAAESNLPRLYKELTGRDPAAPVSIYGLPELRSVRDGVIAVRHRPAFEEAGSGEGVQWREVDTGKDSRMLWTADLRERTFLDKEKKRRRLEGILWKAFVGSGIAALILVLLCLVYGLGNVLLRQRLAKIQAQSPAVAVAEENQMLLGKLEEFSRPPIRPFAMLDLLNEDRPANVYFRVAYADNTDLLIVEGNATNAEEVNRYQRALAGSGKFASVELSEIRSRGGEVQFTMRLRCPPENLPMERIPEVEVQENVGQETPEESVPKVVEQPAEQESREVTP